MNKKILTTGIVAAALLVAPAAFAESGKGKHGDRDGISLSKLIRWDKHDKDNDSRDIRKDFRDKTLTGEVTAIAGSTLTVRGENGTVYIANVANAEFKHGTFADVAVGEKVIIYGDIDGTNIDAKKVFNVTDWRAAFKERARHVTAGVVTSINGSLLSIDPLGKKSTTTVVTNSSTLVQAHGAATSASAITVGSKVVVLGTTTATSTAGDTFVASIIHLIERGFGHIKHWFR